MLSHSAHLRLSSGIAVSIPEPILRAMHISNAGLATPNPGIMVDGKLANSVGLEQGTGTLPAQVLDAAAAKTRVIAMGSPVFGAGLQQHIDLHSHVLQRCVV